MFNSFFSVTKYLLKYLLNCHYSNIVYFIFHVFVTIPVVYLHIYIYINIVYLSVYLQYDILQNATLTLLTKH